MSYCRFSISDYTLLGIHIPKSDVYVFESEFGGIECCGCRLSNNGIIRFKTYTEMINHLRDHMATGHTVPDHVIPTLEAERAEYGDYV